MKEYNFYHRGRDRGGGGGYRGKPYECLKFTENQKGENKLVKEIDFAPAAQHKRELSYFTREAGNFVTLVTFRTSSIAGEQWLDTFINSLDDSVKSKLMGHLSSNRIFEFGKNETLRSIGVYVLPVVIAGKTSTIKTDVLESDIPLSFTKVAMKKAKMKIDLEKDLCEIFGKEVELMTTSSGHYCVPLLSEVYKEEDDITLVLATDFVLLSRK